MYKHKKQLILIIINHKKYYFNVLKIKIIIIT